MPPGLQAEARMAVAARARGFHPPFLSIFCGTPAVARRVKAANAAFYASAVFAARGAVRATVLAACEVQVVSAGICRRFSQVVRCVASRYEQYASGERLSLDPLHIISMPSADYDYLFLSARQRAAFE